MELILKTLTGKVAVAVAIIRINSSRPVCDRNARQSNSQFSKQIQSLFRKRMVGLEAELKRAKEIIIKMYQCVSVRPTDAFPLHDEIGENDLSYAEICSHFKPSHSFTIDYLTLSCSNDTFLLMGITKRFFKRFSSLLFEHNNEMFQHRRDLQLCFRTFGRLRSVNEELKEFLKDRALDILANAFQNCMKIDLNTKCTLFTLLRELTNDPLVPRFLCEEIVSSLHRSHDSDPNPWSFTSWCEAEGDALFFECLCAMLFGATIRPDEWTEKLCGSFKELQGKVSNIASQSIANLISFIKKTNQ